MSYDTTVHDAIDPPQPRIAASQSNASAAASPTRLRYLWRMLAVAGAMMALLALVTWIVALFNLPTADDPHELPNVPTAASSIPSVSLSVDESTYSAEERNHAPVAKVICHNVSFRLCRCFLF